MKAIGRFLKKNSPPGLDASPFVRTAMIGGVIAFLISLIFVGRYRTALASLYVYTKDGYVLDTTLSMPDFCELIEGTLLGFAVEAISLLGIVIYNYLYYRQGRRSIYLMKRLPNRFERHRRALAVPVLLALCCAAAAMILMLLYFALYMIATPRECLTAGQWYKLWRF